MNADEKSAVEMSQENRDRGAAQGEATAPSAVIRPITRVLVANRGEIARRIMRTATEMGIETVAVFTTADSDAPHATEADLAVELAGDSLADTYLSAEALVDAALAAGADAVHPGYGFLSENAGFARAVGAAGLVWIGPDPDAIIAMGSKIAAKELMADAGVPMLADLDPATVEEREFPVLVKASAGGGGRGMRVARSRSELAEQVERARDEARHAFGDDAVFCERYLEHGHHVEVQIMADRHGAVWAVGERECSIQRRHQKIVEEAPSPLVERQPEMREELFEAARSAALAIGYVGAGTVEFLANCDGEFFFLEVNTRLQVEHPVTEATSGLDLVRLQFDVAAGEPLPSAGPPRTRGHAIEARVYAEIPAADYRPSAGTLYALDLPGGDVHRFRSPRGERSYLRLDSAAGERPLAVGTDYDPMISKVIAYAPRRAEAARLLATRLRGARIHGIDTNRDQLVRILSHPDFLAGTASTAFLAETGGDVLAPVVEGAALGRCALAAALAVEDAEAREESGRSELGSGNSIAAGDGAGAGVGICGRAAASPLRGFRNVGAAGRNVDLLPTAGPDRPAVRIEITDRRSAAAPSFARTASSRFPDDGEGAVPPWGAAIVSGRVTLAESPGEPSGGPEGESAGALGDDALAAILGTQGAGWGGVRAEVLVRDSAGVDRRYVVTSRRAGAGAGTSAVMGDASGWEIDVEGPEGATRFALAPRFPDPDAAAGAGSLLAPMPGSIVRIAVAEGDDVAEGQPLLWLEAMKMEHTIAAPAAGIVGELGVSVGEKVDAGRVLVRIDDPGSGPEGGAPEERPGSAG
ncbi:acetyl/propionyl/methylcrotonyl-CoA carboxylase subunit alpha [Dietzia sp.]|uniref:acetyl/propionyl/methylcrotonyl-CoA carboxylase subunit alpha n=1 Tax=Dietzia sp. TaxID=1871616 RepID=UPI002FDB5907